jgi:hypothetical protein
MRRLATFALALALLEAPSAAQAQSTENTRAVGVGRDAAQLYEQGRYAEAYERFALADRMAHSVVFVLYMARCERNLGKLLAARELFERARSEEQPAGATPPMVEAKGEAARELEALARRIPSIAVDVGGPRAGLRVTVDGNPVEPGAAVPVDPGEHTIEARAASGATTSRRVRFEEGSGLTRIALVLANAPPKSADEARPKRGSAIPGIVVLGFGAAGVAMGAITGAMAASKAAAIKSHCLESGGALHCLPTDAQAASTVDALGAASTIGLVVGGVAIAGGGVLLWLRPFGRGAQVHAAFRATPNFVGVSGSF